MSDISTNTNTKIQKKDIGSFIKGTDIITLLTAIAASIYGLLCVYSATYSNLSDGKIITSDVRTMLISVLGGLIIAVVVSNVDYESISKFWPIIAIGCIGLMIFTLLFGVAPPERPDSKCWIDLKVFYFQPSELLKVGFIISFSYQGQHKQAQINYSAYYSRRSTRRSCSSHRRRRKRAHIPCYVYRNVILRKSKRRIFRCGLLRNFRSVCIGVENRDYRRYSKAKNSCAFLSGAICRRYVSAKQR